MTLDIVKKFSLGKISSLFLFLGLFQIVIQIKK